MKIKYLHVVPVLGLTLGACAQFDTGKIDYRKAEYISTETAQKVWSEHREKCWPALPNEGQVKLNAECSFMLPANLTDKNYSKGHPVIAPGDVYSIRLDHGLIAQLHEMVKPWSRRGGKNGEIVILVNAFEFAETAAELKEKESRFTELVVDRSAGTPTLAEARVVYYSPDVEERQDLNFSNIPISGPLKYNGRPVGIQIIVLELDRVSESTKSLLKSLADLGKTYVAPSTVNSVLVNLGKSLVDGNADDVLFEYRLVLDNSASLGDQITPTFTAGKYVFRRQQNRTNPAVWKNLRLDDNTGALFYWKANDGKAAAKQEQAAIAEGSSPSAIKAHYNLETYFTVSVINHGKTGAVAEYAGLKWSELSTRIDNALDDPKLPPAQLNTIVKEATAQRQSIMSMKGVLNEAQIALATWQPYRSVPNAPADLNGYLTRSDYAALSAADQTLCQQRWSALASAVSKNDIALQKAQLDTLTLVRAWKAAVSPAAANAEPKLLPDEQAVTLRQFVDLLHSRFGGLPEGTLATFADPATFKATYLGDEETKLDAVLTPWINKLKGNMPAKCADLL